MNRHHKILFFASGDFAIPTFRQMLSDGYDIVGLVTSNDKVFFNEKRIIEYAEGIPCWTVGKEGVNTPEFEQWVKERNADIFCVISFKYLPDNIVSLAKRCAFNVHASILPFLRGAAPINWAISRGFKQTGLTAFVLNSKIDCGNILSTDVVDIDIDNETYGSLFAKLSGLCVDFTKNVINNIIGVDSFNGGFVKQPICDFGDNVSGLFKAPKLTREYFTHSVCDVTRLLRSVYPVDGIPAVFDIYDKKVKHHRRKVVCKVFDLSVEDVPVGRELNKPRWDQTEPRLVISDCKTYLCIKANYSITSRRVIFIKEIQQEGRKRMDIKEFLKGFHYLKDDRYSVSLSLCAYWDGFSYPFDEYIEKARALLSQNASEDFKKENVTYDITDEEFNDAIYRGYLYRCYADALSPNKALLFLTCKDKK